jgi:hypothetical protein
MKCCGTESSQNLSFSVQMVVMHKYSHFVCSLKLYLIFLYTFCCILQYLEYPCIEN